MILVISHEVGHTFGLQHDGTASTGYYSGHGNWGPIMGAPYGKAVAQWSKGEYTGANNTTQDDVSLIAGYVPYVADDFADTLATARTIESLSIRGMISSAADKDWFKFSFPSGPLRVQLTPAFNPNLDAAIEIWSNGALVSRISPNTLAIDTTLEALPAGEYFVMVEGTGYLNPLTTGYSSYGSIGEYVLTFTGNVSTDPPATLELSASKSFALPGAPVTFSVSSSSHPSFAGVTLNWAFSDGTTASGSSATKTMGSTSLTATVTATTDNGGVTVKTSSVRISRPPTVTTTVSPTAVKAGTNVMFSANGADPDAQTLSYAWAFSDGTTAVGASTIKTKMSVGTLTGTVTVTDLDANTATSSVEASFVANLQPTLTASASPTTLAAPGTVSFSGFAVDPEKTAVTYRWVFSDGTTATTARVAKVVSSAGVFTGTLTATDRDGFSTEKVVSVTATANGAPTITSAGVSAATMAAPAAFTFTTVASDPNRHPLTYRWEFSDGTFLTGARVSKSFSSPGSYTATVTATDPGSLSASRSVPFTVTANTAPTVAVTSSAGLSLVAPATFGLRAVGSDVDKQTLRYAWVFSDGTTATTAAVTKKFLTAGTYTATVTATDTGGLTATKVVTLIVTANTAPTVTATTNASTMAAPALFTLKATGADINKQALTYRWVFSDGSFATTATVSKKFSTVGSHSAVVTVTDTGGLKATQTIALTVTPNTAPTLSASASSLTLSAPASFLLTATGADADAQVLKYKWVFSDKTSSSSALLTKKFLNAGTYTATVTATDPGGLTATRTLTLTVTANVAPTISSAMVSASTAASGTNRTFSAVAADSDNQALSYLWRFTDGTTARGASVIKALKTRGTFSALLTVTDPGGLSATRSVSYTVS
jgi:PKD repeat protein